jgi:phage terminase large subunit-like protein
MHREHDPRRSVSSYTLGAAMRAGPKAAITAAPLDLSWLPKSGGARVIAFIERYVMVTTGKGALEPMKLMVWQKDLLHGLFSRPRPWQALVSIARGNGKSTLSAAIAVYGLFADPDVEGSASVLCLASTERQARIVWGIARRMIELNPELHEQVQVFQDRVYVPETDSTLEPMPAIADALQGYNPSLAVVDELHVVAPDVWAAMLLAGGKRKQSLVLSVSTPAGDQTGAMWRLVELGRRGVDASLYFREYAAPEDCAIDDENMWPLANPAMTGRGAFLNAAGIRNSLGKTSEANFRRYRLGQWAQADEAWMPRPMWDACADIEAYIEDGAEVVLGFDGSISGDATALVVCSIATTPHVDVAGLWERPEDASPDWRVSEVVVENTIRQACERWSVKEIVADTYLWRGMLDRLEADGFPVVEFPQSAARMAPATSKLYDAVAEKQLTHSGDPRLARHISNAIAKAEARGVRLVKEHKKSTRRIDLAIAAVMAHDRASSHDANDYDVMQSAW